MRLRHAEYGVAPGRATPGIAFSRDLPVLREPRAPRRRVPRGRHQGRHPPPPRVPGLRAPLHHLRALRGDAARGGEELGRAPAVRPGEAARRAPARVPQAAGLHGLARDGRARHRGRAAQPAAAGGAQRADRRARAAPAEGDRRGGLRALRVGLPRSSPTWRSSRTSSRASSASRRCRAASSPSTSSMFQTLDAGPIPSPPRYPQGTARRPRGAAARPNPQEATDGD